MADENEAQPGYVNSQIVEAVNITNERVLADSVTESQSVINESYAHSLALFMHNATTTQFAGQQTANAAVATTCSAIIAAFNKVI